MIPVEKLAVNGSCSICYLLWYSDTFNQGFHHSVFYSTEWVIPIMTGEALPLSTNPDGLMNWLTAYTHISACQGAIRSQ